MSSLASWMTAVARAGRQSWTFDRLVPTQLYLRTFFISFLSPLHPGGSGEGPDCHFPKEIVDVGADSGQDQGIIYF